MSLLLSRAIQGYLIDRAAGGLSDSTATLYRKLLAQFAAWVGDQDIAAIKPDDLNAYMAYLRTEYKPKQGGGEHLSGYSLDNHWKAQKSFWKWAAETLEIPRPDLHLARPRYAEEEIIPYTETEMQRILAAVEYSAEARTVTRKTYRLKRPTALRDRAMLLLLLDTGIRVGELSRLRIADVHFDPGEIEVHSYGSGIKSRPRVIPFQRTTRKALWLYLEKDRPDARPNERLFEIEYRSVQSLMQRLQLRTGIDVHAHRFRHTFAIEFLRNGGDVFTLQKLLGHTTLDMVRRYLSIAQSDVANAHRRASPADRWKLS